MSHLASKEKSILLTMQLAVQVLHLRASNSGTEHEAGNRVEASDLQKTTNHF